MKPLVIQTENLPQVCSDWLAERCDLHICPADSLRFKELLPHAEGIVIRTYTTIDAEMLQQATKLTVVGRAGVGVDNIDLEACNEKGVTVVHTPDANSASVVEFVLSTVLATIRNIVPVTSGHTQEEWNSLRTSSMTEREFTETTIGIIGFGRIGSKLGSMATKMGFRVLFHDIRTIAEKHGCSQTTLGAVLSESDVVSIHVDGRIENKHLCNHAMFENMKHTVVFVNASRGFIVDTHALAEFLMHNTSAKAILDVHDPEPIPRQNPLLHLPNATLYPHVACKTNTATENMGWVVKDIYAVLQGEQPAYRKV